MAFTSWADLRTAIKDAIANHVDGTPCVGEYSHGTWRFKYRTFDELLALYEKTFKVEALETPGTVSSRVSYGRHRRFR